MDANRILPTGRELLDGLRTQFYGLNTRYRTADGALSPRIYLDSAATTLMLAPALEVGQTFLHHYASVHTNVHFSAQLTSQLLEQARGTVLEFVGADPARYACVWVGAGSTAALNRAASVLRQQRSDGPVLVSLLEHHSNDLPHRASPVVHVPLDGPRSRLGAVCPRTFAKFLAEHRPVRYAALGMVSNVTGIVNDIAGLVAAAKTEGVPTVVDAAQAVAHLRVRMTELGEPDALAFSGHKIYAPGSPGVLVIRRDLLATTQPFEVGGGVVTEVDQDDYLLTETVPDRHEAGTPNIFGAIVLGATLRILQRIGMDQIHRHERELADHLLRKLTAVPGIQIYGDTDPARCDRIALAAFNLAGLDHGLVAAVLNDHYNIAVRNGCFCAHPYVRTLLAPDQARPGIGDLDRSFGMVRAALGLHSDRHDIDALAKALCEITARADHYRTEYHHIGDASTEAPHPNHHLSTSTPG